MFLSQKGSLGRNPMINRVGQRLLQLFEGASAAYSLRDLASNIASVVRVRRASDNSEKDFSAADVSSGAMTQWVNGQVVPPLDVRELVDGERTGALIPAAAAYSLRNLSASGTSLTTVGDTQTDYFSFTGATGDTAALNGIQYDLMSQYNGAGLYNSTPPSPEDSQMVRDNNGRWLLFRASSNPQGPKTYALSAIGSTEYPWEADWTGTDLENAVFTQQRTGDYVVQVRRSSDSTIRSFTTAQVADGTLTNWVNTSFADALPLDTASGAAAAYSLRNLSSGFIEFVVDVRRSSDNALEAFSAAEVADGTLTDWVNEDVNLYTSDFSVDADGLTSSNGTLAGNIDGIDGVDDTLRFTLSGGDTPHTINVSSAGSGLSYTLSFDYYIPSANTALDGIEVQVTSSSYTSGILNVTDTWTTVNRTLTPDATGTLRFRTLDGGSATPDGDGDVVYFKNIVFTQTTADGFVTRWYDQSGNGNHANQANAASQPKIVDAGSLNKDSDNNTSVKFESSAEQHLTNTSLPSSFTSSNATFSDFTVLEAFQNNVTGVPFSFGSTSSSSVRLNKLMHSSGNYGYQGFGSTASFQSSFDTAPYSANEVFLGSSTRVGTDLDIFTNGADVDIDNNFDTGTTAINNFTIGAYIRSSGLISPFNGNITEIIIYNSDQSDKRRAIEENIGSNYGITLTSSKDGTVSTWYDQSGNANHATQTDAASQPKIVDAGALLTAGVTFDGSNDHFDFTEISNSGAFSLFIASNITNNGGMVFGDNGGASNYVRYESANSVCKIANTEYDFGDSRDTSLDIINFNRDGSNSLSANRNAAAIGSPQTATGTFDINLIGVRNNDVNPITGAIKELIIYSTDQSANRTAFEANIGETYGIDLPSGVDTGYDEVDGFVETWYDQSGNGNDAVQATAGSQPKIVDAGVLVSGGILSDGAGTFLELDSTLSITDEFDIFFTGTATASNWTTLQRSPYGFSTNSDYPRVNDDAFRYKIANTDSAGINYNGGFTIGVDTPFLYNFNRDASDSVGAQINGTAQTNRVTLSGTHLISQLFRRGSNTSQVWDGTMSEMIFYGSDQSANRVAIEANINNQYDIY